MKKFAFGLLLFPGLIFSNVTTAPPSHAVSAAIVAEPGGNWQGSAVTSAAEGQAKAEAEKKKQELKAKIVAAVKTAMNKALDEARARGGSSWDAAAKIANAQGMEQLYAQGVQDAANVGLVFYTDGLEEAYNLRLAQLSRDGLSKAVLGYVTTAYPPLGVVLGVYDALKALFSFDFSSIGAHQKRNFMYDQIREQVIASSDSVLQTQYINLRILWLSYRSLNDLGPDTMLNPWGMYPYGQPVTFDQIFQAVLTKKGGYDSNMWGDGSTRSIEFLPAYGFWGSRWIGWPGDPDDDDLAFYTQELSNAYAAYKMAPISEASNNIVELIFGSIQIDLRRKREEEAAKKAAEEAARKAAELADRNQAAQDTEADYRASCDYAAAEEARQSSRTALASATSLGGPAPSSRVALLIYRIKSAGDYATLEAEAAHAALGIVRSPKSTNPQMWAAVADCSVHANNAILAASEAEHCRNIITSAKKHDQEEAAIMKVRLEAGKTPVVSQAKKAPAKKKNLQNIISGEAYTKTNQGQGSGSSNAKTMPAASAKDASKKKKK